MFKGKAGSLKFLNSLGLNVPDFLVLNHAQVVSWGDEVLYQNLLKSLDQNNIHFVMTNAHEFIKSLTIPELELDDQKSYAVRSSASTEDSPDHSFAGIFETKLYVKDLASAIIEVWLSLFDNKSLQYCLDRKIPWQNLKMDIVIQEMITGEKSGVLFQADPTGKITQQIIVAGPGLGQGIVNEETDTDRYIIEDDQIIESHIQNKTNYMTFNSGVEKQIIPEEKKNISVLTEAEIKKLLLASRLLSKHSEYFLDIEFTFRGDKLYILQARPITTIPSKRNTHLFDNSNIAENYPGFSTPLTYSGLARGYSTNFKNLIRFIGLKDEDWSYLNNHLNQLVGYWGGRIYYNLNNWNSVYTLLPFGAKKAVASFNEMVGIQSESIIKIPDRTLRQKIKILIRIMPKFLSFYFFSKTYYTRYNSEFKELHHKFLNKSDEAQNSFELIHLLDQLDNEYFKIIKIPLFNDFMSSILNRACRLLAKSLIPSNGEQLYNDLLGKNEDIESSKAIYSLIELSELVQNDSKLESHLSCSLEPVPEFKHFFDKLQIHFDRYGDRSQWEMKIEMPTARENPETTIRLVLEYARARMSRKAQRLLEDEKSSLARAKFKAQTLKKPLTAILFWHLFKKCSKALSFRENSRFDRVRFKGMSRKIILRLGSFLVEKKWLNFTEDIFYLTYDEITSLIHDSYGPLYWNELVNLRKKHLDKLKNLKLPDRIITNDLTSVEKFSVTTKTTNSHAIYGIPCSGGVAEFDCEVVLDLNQAPSLTGKILVAERTDPAWGYFFVGVKGIIIEKGSMLSHAAIISRELGIPCIINVQNATQLLKSGVRIRMNGDTGEIQICKRDQNVT